MPPVSAPPPPFETLDNLRAIFSSVTEGILMQSAAGEIVECNASAERVLGLSRAQLMGRTSVDPRWRAIREDGSDFPGSEHPPMVALASGTPVRDVLMGVYKPDGTLSWISVNSVPIYEDGIVVRVVSTFSDVTARREAEVEAERLRHDIQESQRMLAAIGDVQGRFIAHEDLRLVFERILTDLLWLSGSRSGFIAEAVCAEDGRAALEPRASTDPRWDTVIRTHATCTTGMALASLVARTVSSGDVVIADRGSLPSSLRPASDEHQPIDSYLGLPLHVGTQFVGMVGLGNRTCGYDKALIARLSPYLTTCSQLVQATRQQLERERAERALAEQRERMSLVLEASGIGHWDWNPVTDEAVFDEQWTGIIGYKPGEIEGSGAQWLRLLHPDDLPATLDAVKRHMAGETPEHRAEFRMRHRDGSWVWVLAVGRVIERHTSGQVTRMVGVHVDISTHKAYETALADATTEAQRANRAKSEFLANMSHEIRTPMNGVIGAANLLLFTDLSDEQREYTDTIRRSGELLLSLIDDVLDLSKIEAERLELEHISFDPRETIAEVVDLETTRADSKGLELVLDWRSRPVSQMVGDSRRVQQVLLNLLSNAIKFTTRGLVVVSAERTNASELRIAVTDTGIGIPAEKQTLVFETFMQADTSTTRRFGGSGLGLAISRRLVEAMGGTIGVSSVHGEGSTFWFTLPLPPSQGIDSDADAPLRGANVLMVDSCHAAADAASRLLEHHGAQATCVPDIEDAERLLAHRSATTTPFDVVIAKYAPEHADVLARLESDSRLGHVSLIVTVRANQRREALKAVAGTRAQVLRTPVTRPGEFIRVCANAVADTRSRRSRFAEQAARAVVRPEAAKTGLAFRHPSGRKLRVLLVEDDEISRLVGRRMLEKHGCDVALADDGRKALEMTREQPFDLVFMDCNMPHVDGFEASAAIRGWGPDASSATRSSVPIIAVTANVLVGDRDRCLAAGMVDYIAKPLLLDSVADMLARWSPKSEDIANSDS